MISITQSLREFLIRKGMLKELTLLSFGHTEVYTPELQKEYLEWVQTEEGRAYLKGGEKYDVEYGDKIDKIMDDGAEVHF